MSTRGHTTYDTNAKGMQHVVRSRETRDAHPKKKQHSKTRRTGKQLDQRNHVDQHLQIHRRGCRDQIREHLQEGERWRDVVAGPSKKAELRFPLCSKKGIDNSHDSA